MENGLMKNECDSRELNLSGLGLTCLYHVDKMVLLKTLDLSNNCLSSLPDLRALSCLQNINLDGNTLASQELEKLPPHVTYSIQNNTGK